MKKSLLIIAIAVLSLGTKAQVTPSPFWTNQNSNFSITSAGIRYMHVVNPNVVWAVGYNGTVATANFNEFTRTINGGANYVSGPIYSSTVTYFPASIEALNADTAWVTAYLTAGNMGAIHQTTNGGVTWTNMTPVGMYTNSASFANITTFFTPLVGITMGDPVGGDFEIHRTTNGGMTWTKVPGANIPAPLGGEYGLTDVYTRFGANDVWFGTNLGRVYHSNDQGQTWTVGSIGATPYVNDIAFRDAMNGIVMTNSNTAYTTSNGGSTWTQIPSIDPNMGLNSICAIPGTSWYASCGAGTGNNVISYSTDDGATWNSWGGMNVQYLHIEFVDNTTGYAGGFSDFTTVGLDGMFKYNGAVLGINSNSTPLANNDVYPNPSSGLVTINLAPSKHGAIITVIDAMGKTVYTENVKNGSFEKYSLNLEGFAKGIYSVNISRPTGVETKKIIIQ
ncbi:MAG: T9SS type A sorting domain-containing protein [Bacteroidia bacterium]|nr:T9SS type A sorting domain-containing protein [Bacteroidia bacterium]